MITSNDLVKLTNGLNIVESLNNVASLGLLKMDVPFSERLNDFIREWFSQNWDKFIFTDEDDFNPDDIEGTLQNHIKRYEETGKIYIWTGASDRTIFGEPTVNHYFRAWHDYIHITNNLGYDFVGESIVCEIQKSMLPIDWVLERNLVHAEIIGQAQYFMLNGEFLNDQRKFTRRYLVTPHDALTTKGL